MATKKTARIPTPQDKATLLRVRAAFTAKGESLQSHCEKNNLNRGNVDKALLGQWRGKKGKALRSQIIQASKAKAKPTPTPEATR